MHVKSVDRCEQRKIKATLAEAKSYKSFIMGNSVNFSSVKRENRYEQNNERRERMMRQIRDA